MPIHSADENGSDTDIDHIVYEVDSKSEGSNDVYEKPSESAEAELSKSPIILITFNLLKAGVIRN